MDTVVSDNLKISKPSIEELTGKDGIFASYLCVIGDLLDKEYKKGRIKGTDYAKVLADSIQGAMKSATDFITQKELVAAQALFYKEQAEKYKQDAKLVASTEIKMKAELANEVLKGCLTKEQTKTQEKQTLKVACETNKCEEEIKLLKERTSVEHEMINQTKAKTSNIKQNTLLTASQTAHEDKKKLVTIEQIGLTKNQADHEKKKELNTIQDTKLLECKTAHECALEKDVKAHTLWMGEHTKVEHELIAYTKAKADLEQQRVDTEKKRIELMEAQISLEKAKLPLMCAQTKVELRKVDVMAYDALYKKITAMVQAKEVSVKKAEIGLMCAKAKVEQTKSYMTKYQALGILEQSKTEQVKRETLKYGILESKAKAQMTNVQVVAAKVNAQLLKQKVKTELAQGRTLEGKLKLFSAQYAGLVNDAKLRERKLKDDVRISQATLSLDGEVTGLNEETVDLVSPVDIPTTITEAEEPTVPDVDTSPDFEITEPTLPDGDSMPDLDCDIPTEEVDADVDNIPFSDVDCSSGSISGT